MKTECKIVVKNLMSMFKELAETNRKQQEEINQLKKNSSTPAAAVNNAKFDTYADCVNNKKQEHLVIVKNKSTERIDLRKVLYSSLKGKENEVDLSHKIKVNKRRLIVNASNEKQQHLIIDQLKKNVDVEAFKPTKRIPSLYVKNI